MYMYTMLKHHNLTLTYFGQAKPYILFFTCHVWPKKKESHLGKRFEVPANIRSIVVYKAVTQLRLQSRKVKGQQPSLEVAFLCTGQTSHQGPQEIFVWAQQDGVKCFYWCTPTETKQVVKTYMYL